MKRALTSLTLAALVSLVAGCGDDDAETGATGGADDSSQVEVLDSGDGDKVRFEVDVEEGHRETLVLELAQTIDTGTPIDTPKITFTIETEVIAVDDDEVTIEQTYAAIEVGGDEAVAAQVEETLAPMIGLTGTLTIEPDGALVESSIEAPDDLDPTIAAVFDQIEDQAGALSVVFPREDLGAGARWSTVSDLDLNGISVEQTTTYTLDSLDGEDYTISAEVDQAYEAGQTEQFELLDGSGSATGSFTGTIGLVFPAASSSTATNELRVSVDGQESTVTTDIETSVVGTVGTVGTAG